MPARGWIAAGTAVATLISAGAAQGQTMPGQIPPAPTATGPSSRGQPGVGVEVGMGYSDNINRLESPDDEDAKIGTVGLNLNWQKQTRRVNASALADLSYYEYFDSDYDGEINGIADATLLLAIVPDRFTWTFQDSFGQAQSDPFAAVTPDNRENVNYFTTGPEFTLGLGSANAMRLYGLYSKTSYEESPLDADRNSVGISVGRHPSPSSEIALNAVRESTDFAEVASPDYDRESAFLSYDTRGGRTTVTGRLGYSRLKPDGGTSDGGLLATLSLARRVSASSTITIEGGRQFTDAGESLRSGLSGGGTVGGGDITASADPFENTHGTLRWDFSRNRTDLRLGGSWNQDRYEQQTAFDRTRYAYEASITRRMSPVLNFTLLAVLNTEKFDNADVDSDELNLALRVQRQLGRRLGLAITAERSQRDTTEEVGNYDENRVFISFTYTPVGDTVRPTVAP
jgi:hypothetical protein